MLRKIFFVTGILTSLAAYTNCNADDKCTCLHHGGGVATCKTYGPNYVLDSAGVCDCYCKSKYAQGSFFGTDAEATCKKSAEDMGYKGVNEEKHEK